MFGFLGHGASYDEESGLYVEAKRKDSGGGIMVLRKFLSFVSSQMYRLLRDVYFVVIMMPIHEVKPKP